MQGMASRTACLSPSSQIAFQDLQNSQQQQQQQQLQIPNPQIEVQGSSSHFDHPSHDDFYEQMFSNLPSWSELPGNPKSPWENLNPQNPNINNNNSSSSNKNNNNNNQKLQGNLHYHFDDSTVLASQLQQHQISGNSPSGKSMMLQQQHQQILLPTRSPSSNGCATYLSGDSGLFPLPLTLGSGGDSSEAHLLADGSREDIVDASFKSHNPNQECSIQTLYNGLAGALPVTSPTAIRQHFHHPQTGSISTQNYGAPATGMNQAPAVGSTGGGGTAPARQRVRARRGQATDPHSIAERLRREKIAERMKALQELVPNANKTDKASMLDEIIDYVKFLRLQVKVLSMSRLGGASAAVAPFVADTSDHGGGDCIQASNGIQTTSSSDNLTMTEQQVVKMMEEDMGSAMQYLQGKGLCLMPISLATAISTATCHSRNSLNNNHHNVDGPSSPCMSVLTVQSATLGNGHGETSVKDATSVSKP